MADKFYMTQRHSSLIFYADSFWPAVYPSHQFFQSIVDDKSDVSCPHGMARTCPSYVIYIDQIARRFEQPKLRTAQQHH